MNRPVIIGFLLFLVVFGAILWIVRKREPAPTKQPAESVGTKAEQQPAEQETRRINVKLYFAGQNGESLVPEERSIKFHETLQSQATEVLKELIQGPSTELIPTIPEGTSLRDIFVTKEGTAYVDFSPELSANHQGGSTGEMMTVYSIVNTLTLNFPQIRRVQILVDDREVDTLKGHLDLTHPIARNSKIVTETKRAADENSASL